MGFRFRKSANIGPLRVNLSKSGVGYSVGGKGFRVTKRADGKTQTTASVPGTGIAYTKVSGSGSGKSSGRASSGSASGKKKKPVAPIVIAVLILLGLIGCMSSGGDTSSESKSDEKETADVQTEKAQEEIYTEVAEEPADSGKPAADEQPETPAEAPQEATEAPKEETPAEPAETPAEEPASAVVPVPVPESQPEPTPEPEPEPVQQNEKTVYVTKTGKRYHYDSSCNGGTYYPATLTEAKNRGLTPCQKCVG